MSAIAVCLLLSVGAAMVAFVFITTDWGRVVAILRSGPTSSEPEADRWRRVHLDADRRQPFEGRGRR